MSLTRFLSMPGVSEKLKPLRPKGLRTIDKPLLAEPRSNRYGMVGTAFDYLLRFELRRRAPHAVVRKWIAEYAPDLLWRETPKFSGGFDLLRVSSGTTEYKLPEEVGKRARGILNNAKRDVSTYLKTKNPDRSQVCDLAAHAIRLSKLDTVFRTFSLDPCFHIADTEDVEDSVSMLDIVPYSSLLNDKLMLLNPDFEESSRLFGGADADLITGDLLVDFKVSKKAQIVTRQLNQLLGYYLLCRNQRRVDPKFPQVNKVALYFCRYAYLWILDAKMWLENPDFAEVERWFFKRAKEIFNVEKRAKQV